jgi:uncharacterized protein (DUF1330 family)
MSAITPGPETIRAFLAAPASGPVVMLNLLKFKPGGGAASYMRYAAGVAPLLVLHGARILYSGRVEHTLVGEPQWDAIAIVEYPSREAFLAMATSPEYQQVHVHREHGLERTELIATSPMQGGLR